MKWPISKQRMYSIPPEGYEPFWDKKFPYVFLPYSRTVVSYSAPRSLARILRPVARLLGRRPWGF